MHAIDVMTTNVVSVGLNTEVDEIARILLKHGISAVPVTDDTENVVGIVSEGDLFQRPENETENKQSWWLQVFLAPKDRAADFIKTHGRKAKDVMTRNVVNVTEETPLHEIAHLLEKHRIKRVPVTRDGRLVGIVSRANLLHGLAARGPEEADVRSVDDQAIRQQLLETLTDDIGLNSAQINVVVRDGTVQFWGLVDSVNEIDAARIAAENTPGVKKVENNLGYFPPGRMGY